MGKAGKRTHLKLRGWELYILINKRESYALTALLHSIG
jgi:hypothetical protein